MPSNVPGKQVTWVCDTSDHQVDSSLRSYAGALPARGVVLAAPPQAGVFPLFSQARVLGLMKVEWIPKSYRNCR